MDNFHFQCLGGAGNNAVSASFALVFLNSHNAILAVNHIKVAALHTDTAPNTRIGCRNTPNPRRICKTDKRTAPSTAYPRARSFLGSLSCFLSTYRPADL